MGGLHKKCQCSRTHHCNLHHKYTAAPCKLKDDGWSVDCFEETSPCDLGYAGQDFYRIPYIKHISGIHNQPKLSYLRILWVERHILNKLPDVQLSSLNILQQIHSIPTAGCLLYNFPNEISIDCMYIPMHLWLHPYDKNHQIQYSKIHNLLYNDCCMRKWLKHFIQ
jgi:hypothetical protein